MILGMNNQAWTMIGASIGIAFLSAMIGDVLSIKKKIVCVYSMQRNMEQSFSAPLSQLPQQFSVNASSM